MFEYKAEIVRVIDGDTVVARIDLGFATFAQETLRLHGIDAPEIRGSKLSDTDRKKGHASTEHLKLLIEQYGPIELQTFKNIRGQDRTGKFGRYLAILHGRDEHGPININDQMIRDGHAVALN